VSSRIGEGKWRYLVNQPTPFIKFKLVISYDSAVKRKTKLRATAQ